MSLFVSKEMDYIGLISIDSKHSCGFTLYLKYIINNSFQKFPRHKFMIEKLSPTHDLTSHKGKPAKMCIYPEYNSKVLLELSRCNKIVTVLHVLYIEMIHFKIDKK